MEILSTHKDVWKCEIVKIPLTPRPFFLFQLKIAFFLHISPKIYSHDLYIWDFFVPLHKIWHVPFLHQKRNRPWGRREGEEVGKKIMWHVPFCSKKGTCHKEAWGGDERGKRWRREGQNIAARCSRPHFLAARARLEEIHISTFPHIHVGSWYFFKFAVIYSPVLSLLIKFFTFPLDFFPKPL